MSLIKNSYKLTLGVFLFALALALTSYFLFSFTNNRSSVYSNVLGQGGKYTGCTTIQDGTLLTSDGQVITTSFDNWGYNYQAMLFNGGYCDAYRDAAWCQPDKSTQLMMKWNDAWLSNKDCSGDGLLDRHLGFPSYVGSGAWLTNHMWESYSDDNGKEHNWTYFVKIVAVPSNAVLDAGVWYDVNGDEIGPEIWGEFAIIEELYNDPYGGFHGLEVLVSMLHK